MVCQSVNQIMECLSLLRSLKTRTQSFQYRQDFNALKEFKEHYGNQYIQGYTVFTGMYAAFWTIKEHTGQCAAIQFDKGLNRTINNNMFTCDYLGRYRTTQDIKIQNRKIYDYTGLYKTIKDYTGLQWTIQDYSGLCKTK